MARAGRMRKTPLAAKKLETAAVRFPCCRSKIKAEKKANFTSCGEATTFQGTYSGVVFRSTAELPLVDVTHKGPALNCMDPTLTFNGPEDWVDRYGPSDVPLFWQESKPVSFWSAILEEFKFKSVFDCTAGSGALMEACLSRGVAYHGVCLSRSHMQWLQSIADRAACTLVACQGSTLFAEGLAAEVKKLFNDVLESMQLAENEDDPAEPEGDDS